MSTKQPAARALSASLDESPIATTRDGARSKAAQAPSIGVPTITLEGDANGAPHPKPEAYAAKFTGPYEHRLLQGGVGHNPPQEAPQAFVQAVIDAAAL